MCGSGDFWHSEVQTGISGPTSSIMTRQKIFETTLYVSLFRFTLKCFKLLSPAPPTVSHNLMFIFLNSAQLPFKLLNISVYTLKK